jgi:hypothetical protein
MSNECENVFRIFKMTSLFTILYSSLRFSAVTNYDKGSEQHRYNGE